MEEFKTLIQRAIDLGLQEEIAYDNETNKSTVARWANGVSRPHPLLEEIIRNRVLTMIEEL